MANSPHSIIPLLFLAFLVSSAFTNASTWTSWTASSIIDTAADLLEQGDAILRDNSDPLVESMKENGSDSKIPNMNTPVEGLKEKFIVPILTGHLGDNNQLMEYMTSAVVAKATNRTLCLTPFFSGPRKHAGQLPRLQGAGLAMEERYDIPYLAKFVNVTPLERCLQRCNKQLDSIWWLRRTSSSPGRVWKSDPNNVRSHDLAWSFVKWTSMIDIGKSFKEFDQEKCVALGGLFPGLRWRGAYLASSMFLRPAQSVSRAATVIQERAIGPNRSFVAVHWRFEESNCRGHELGLCFIRCNDGSEIDSGLHPSAIEWVDLGQHKCPHDHSIRGVSVSKLDLIAAIQETAKKDKVDVVYLATDGWMRGPKELALVKEVVNQLRDSGLEVVGLWKIEELPNFSDGKYFDATLANSVIPKVTGHTISQIEQEICHRAYSFLGSGESTWSLSVFRSRLAERKSQQIRQAWEKIATNQGGKMDDEVLIERLLGDEHAAGMQCRYSAYFRRAKVNSTVETYEDEGKDGWLDMEACEGRIGKGGKCQVAACF